MVLTAWIAFLLAAAAPQEETILQLAKEADALYARRAEDGMARKAVETWQKVLALDESRVEAYWKIALACYWLGSHEKDSAQQVEIFREGIEFAKMGVAVDEKCVPAHYWLGVLYGLFGQSKGVFQSLHMVDPIKKEMEWVLAHNEKFSGGGPHRVLGRLHYMLPGFQGGDNAKAETHLRRSLEIGPDIPLTYLYLAEVLVATGKKDEAKDLLRKMTKLEDHPDWIPESREQKKQGADLLASLEREKK